MSSVAGQTIFYRPNASREAASAAAVQVSVAEGYERWAPIYDETPNPLLALEERCVVPYLPDLAGKQVLDLACGTGRWLSILASRGAVQCLGVDISPAMLRVASTKRAARHGLIRANCLDLPLAAKSVDFAICSFGLSHVPNLAQFAAECARVLRPGAALFVTDLHPHACSAGWRAGFRDHRGAAEIESVPRSFHDIVRAFGSSGFDCTATAGFRLGEPEQPLFAAAGKEGFFAPATETTAVLFCRFRRAN